MSADPMLGARNVTLRVAGRALVSGLDWQVQAGELWCLLGRNGAGKTTLLHALAGLRKPDSGEVRIDSLDPRQAHPARLAQLRGYMAQEQSDAFAWPVLDTVLLGRTPWRVGGQWDSEEEHLMARSALRQVGLDDFERRNVQQLSGGERQRVALATLLVQEPRLMLLDEPLSHQDVAQQLKLMQLLASLLPAHAVVMSCHDINLAARYATHVLLLGTNRHWLGPASSVLAVDNLEAAYGCRFSREGRLFMPAPDCSRAG